MFTLYSLISLLWNLGAFKERERERGMWVREAEHQTTTDTHFSGGASVNLVNLVSGSPARTSPYFPFPISENFLTYIYKDQNFGQNPKISSQVTLKKFGSNLLGSF